MALVPRKVYDQMLDPRYLMSIGSSANACGDDHDCRSVVRDCDRIVPVGSMCRAAAETLLHRVMSLEKKTTRTGAIKVLADRSAQDLSARLLCAANDLNSRSCDTSRIGTRVLPGERLLFKLLRPPSLYLFQDVLGQVLSIHGVLFRVGSCRNARKHLRGRNASSASGTHQFR